MMMQRADSLAISHSRYEDMPFALVLFRYLWPFWLFKDASHGDRYARAAAYRHNRDMRVYLPGYIGKWAFNCVITYALVATAGSLSMPSSEASGMATLFTAAAAVVFAFSVVVLFVTGYVYVYLNRNDV